MDEKDIVKKKRIPNPTGKGGFKERPHDARPDIGTATIIAKAEERKAEKAFLFRDHQNRLKEHMLGLALHGSKEDSVRAKATETILKFIADGNPDKVLEKSDSDEFGTLDEKLKQISDVYIEAQLKNQELEKKIAKLEAMLVSKDKPEDQK